MKVWITKYALTTGIYEAEVEETHCASMVSLRTAPGSFSQYFHGEGKDWHRTKESAVARAESMRIKKIASLKKSLAAFEKLRF